MLIAESLGYAPFIYTKNQSQNEFFGTKNGYGDDYSDCGVIKYGAKDDDRFCVSRIQGYLTDVGLLTENDIDGVFGSKTLSAVEQFQDSRGLTVDGEVGQQTWAALASNAPAVKTVQPAPTISPSPSPSPSPYVPQTQTKQESFLQKYLPYILIGGGGILLVFFMTLNKPENKVVSGR